MKTGCFIYTLLSMLTVMAVLLSACAQSQRNPSPETTTTTTTTATATTPTEEAVNPFRFTGKVLEVNDGMALMECYDKDKFDTVLVNYSNTPSVTPQIGEVYNVVYEDLVMPSLPPRIFAVEMTLLYSESLEK